VRTTWLLAVVLAAGAAPASGATCDGVAPSLVVRGGRLVDGTGGAALEDAVVVMHGDRIEAVGAEAEVALPACRSEIDATGGTVLPGLVDGHVHLTSVLRRQPELRRAWRDWLDAGVTSLIDLGSLALPDALRAAVAAAVPEAPRVFASGPILTAPGGYPFRRDGSSALEVSDAADAAAAVNRLVNGGADLIKVAIERGFLADLDQDGWPVPSPEQLRTIVETAHARGLRVSAHLTQRGELAAALAAGVDDLAHAPIDRLTDEEIAELVDRAVVVTTTLSLWPPGEPRDAACANLRRLLDAGGRIALGTDGPAFQAPGLPSEEIARLAACPLSPMEIVVAATSGAAASIGRASEVGVVRPGARADLLIVDGDPLADPAALRRVRAVVLHGSPLTLRAD